MSAACAEPSLARLVQSCADPTPPRNAQDPRELFRDRKAVSLRGELHPGSTRRSTHESLLSAPVPCVLTGTTRGFPMSADSATVCVLYAEHGGRVPESCPDFEKDDCSGDTLGNMPSLENVKRPKH